MTVKRQASPLQFCWSRTRDLLETADKTTKLVDLVQTSDPSVFQFLGSIPSFALKRKGTCVSSEMKQMS